MLTNEISYKYILMGAFLFIFAQGGAWLQHNLQFKYPKLGPEWWGWYVASIPITWLFLKSTQLGVHGFGGSVWANRFLGFSVGIIVYGFLTQWFFGQPITPKVLVQIILAICIMAVQFIMK